MGQIWLFGREPPLANRTRYSPPSVHRQLPTVPGQSLSAKRGSVHMHVHWTVLIAAPPALEIPWPRLDGMNRRYPRRRFGSAG